MRRPCPFGSLLTRAAPSVCACCVLQDAARESIIRELIDSPLLPRLLQDGYGNYVIQVGGRRRLAAG